MADGMFLNSTIIISLGKSFFIYAVQIHLNKEAFGEYVSPMAHGVHLGA